MPELIPPFHYRDLVAAGLVTLDDLRAEPRWTYARDWIWRLQISRSELARHALSDPPEPAQLDGTYGIGRCARCREQLSQPACIVADYRRLCLGCAAFGASIRVFACDACSEICISHRSQSRAYCSRGCATAGRSESRRRYAEKRRQQRQYGRCQLCDVALEGRRADARYCSPACRQAAHRRRRS